jgi:hypothetical protein
MKTSAKNTRRPMARLAIGAAIASLVTFGVAKAAETDGITNSSNVPVSGHLFTCGAKAITPPTNAPPWTPSAFSFDISWVDHFDRAYFLADRSHNGVTATNGGFGDVLMIDINSINLRSPNPTIDNPANTTYLIPPANDVMAGMGCDMNTAFGGTAGVGRNEITGPNGLFTVNHAEVWVGDGPVLDPTGVNKFQPVQFNVSGKLTLTNPSTPPSTTITSCSSTGAICTYSGVASDYAADPCNSSVRVFDIASRQQTDHIDIGGCFRTDEGAFDPDDQVALFANPSEQTITSTNFKALNSSPFITLISTRPVAPGKHHPILKQINFNGKNHTPNANGGIEQAVYSHKTGLFYIALPGNSAAPNNGFVVVVDPSDRDNIRVSDTFNLTNCSPNGADLGPDNELLLGCGVGPEQVIDIRNGHLIRAIAGTVGGCDEVAFNAGDNHFLGACTDSNAAQDNLDISDADPVKLDQALNTHTAGAHSVAADPVTVADFVPASAASTVTGNPNVGGLCGTTSPCVLIYTSSGHDDPSEWQQEASEDRSRDDRSRDDDSRDDDSRDDRR